MTILAILQHALGLDEFGQGDSYRDHFVAGPGHMDYSDCQKAAAQGLMRHHKNKHVCGGHVFIATDAGREYVREHSPPAPVKTPAQIRYERYLNIGDMVGCSTFREFLRWEAEQKKAAAAIPF